MTCSRHRDNCLVDIFLAKTEGDEFLFEVFYRILNMAAALQLLQLNAVRLQPFAIGMRLCQLLLDFAIIVDSAFLRIDEQNLTWLQASFADYFAWLEVHHSDLGSHDNHAVLGDGVTTWTQTISVEHAACKASITKEKRSRTVPRLHQNGMVFVESLQVFADGVLVVEAFRYQNRHCLRQR